MQMLRQYVSVHEPKALRVIIALQFERHQALVISDAYRNPLGSSNVAVATFELVPTAKLCEAVCEMIKGKSSTSLSEMSKRARTWEDICAITPLRTEQQ
jgi:hypothetical protein